MKDYTNFGIDKPFSCDFDGCNMKFVSENDLIVHKKKHDMVLNLGLTNKTNTFTDETPTPTRFLRKCEEVGLFQDLQNVNPFEETFRKAAEAIKTGQLPNLGKPLETNPVDDTLHTPNIFPNITDAPIQSLSQYDIESHSAIIINNTITKEANGPLVSPQELRLTNETETIIHVHTSSEKENLERKAAPETIADLSSLLTHDKPDSHSVRGKLRDSLRIKSVDELNKKTAISLNTKSSVQGKVPIPSRYSTSLNVPAEQPYLSTSIYESAPAKTRKTSGKYLLQETRSEYLARNRASATRCREKKKMYVSYLEKLNKDLTNSKHNLELLNISLNNQILKLQEELSRHRNCNLFNMNSQVLLDSIPTRIITQPPVNNRSTVRYKRILSQKLKKTVKEKQVEIPSDVCKNSDLFSLSIAEVVISNQVDDDVVPILNENKTSDIIAHFSSSEVKTVLVNHNQLSDMTGEFWKKITDEHSYISKKSFNIGVDLNNTLLSYNIKTSVTENTQFSNDQAKRQFSEVKSIDTNSPTLSNLSVKPFKKRKLSSKQSLNL